jgi:hypothetical protein
MISSVRGALFKVMDVDRSTMIMRGRRYVVLRPVAPLRASSCRCVPLVVRFFVLSPAICSRLILRPYFRPIPLPAQPPPPRLCLLRRSRPRSSPPSRSSSGTAAENATTSAPPASTPALHRQRFGHLHPRAVPYGQRPGLLHPVVATSPSPTQRRLHLDASVVAIAIPPLRRRPAVASRRHPVEQVVPPSRRVET